MLKLKPKDVPDPLRRHWLHYWCIYGLLTGLDFVWSSVRGVFVFQIVKVSVAKKKYFFFTRQKNAKNW